MIHPAPWIECAKFPATDWSWASQLLIDTSCAIVTVAFWPNGTIHLTFLHEESAHAFEKAYNEEKKRRYNQ